jgi:hypothetical protein
VPEAFFVPVSFAVPEPVVFCESEAPPVPDDAPDWFASTVVCESSAVPVALDLGASVAEGSLDESDSGHSCQYCSPNTRFQACHTCLSPV